MNKSLVLILSLVILTSCNDNKRDTAKTVKSKIKPKIEKPVTYGITGEEIELRTGPGEEFEKVINYKTSRILKKTIYTSIDYSVKVIIKESNGEWSNIQVVSPSNLSNSHKGWILTKYILLKSKKIDMKLKLFNDVNALSEKLTKISLGSFRQWDKDELGWYTYTKYFSFGGSSDINGMQNNIAFYINGRQEEAVNEVKIVLNINNGLEKSEALKRLQETVKKTLNIIPLESPDELFKSIISEKECTFEYDNYKLVFEFDKSKIDTWNFLIISK